MALAYTTTTITTTTCTTTNNKNTTITTTVRPRPILLYILDLLRHNDVKLFRQIDGGGSGCSHEIVQLMANTFTRSDYSKHISAVNPPRNFVFCSELFFTKWGCFIIDFCKLAHVMHTQKNDRLINYDYQQCRCKPKWATPELQQLALSFLATLFCRHPLEQQLPYRFRRRLLLQFSSAWALTPRYTDFHCQWGPLKALFTPRR